MQNQKIRFMIETAMCAALALILDQLSFSLPQGGSVSLSMLPIFLLSFRWGFKGGLVNGFLFGMLQLALAPKIYYPIQGAIDYFVAFTVLGFAGLFANQVKAALQQGKKGMVATYITIGVFLGSLGRYLAHVMSGVVFFGEYAPPGTPALEYSLIYNLTYMGPSFALCSIILILVLSKSPRLTNTLTK
ncbi:energy-coupled thiamine transporter ThiT [Priestia taiwanensis]|uniref:Thiamine transporter ThiT n=1 Tax=Priestia taiwanensis TaxID=1347902 RepID=A0A917AVD7_9BACI|nr:energy-coupled thiamine transporter ThiT [Priestia taiwanensis]MBM7364690.1 thiamine transporter [Priestia taiwanensis]GGE78905.1 thiamine transporter ThiT [Priestia taiwanensis]